MSGLPKLDLPRYKHFLVGLNKTVTFRGFTVKEQKILLHAKESDDEEQTKDAINQVISLCLYDDINVDDLAFFDVEDLFLRIRAKSVSNTVELKYRVKDEEGNKTKDSIIVKIDLDDVKVTQPEGHDKKIQLSDNIGVVMKYPSLHTLGFKQDTVGMIKESIDFIYNDDEVFYLKDYTDADYDEFIESLDKENLDKFKNYFQTMPRLRYTREVKLPNGETTTLEFEGLSDFFQ